jgi:hypothetical protein
MIGVSTANRVTLAPVHSCNNKLVGHCSSGVAPCNRMYLAFGGRAGNGKLLPDALLFERCISRGDRDEGRWWLRDFDHNKVETK